METMAGSSDVTLGLGDPIHARPPWPGSPISTRWTAPYLVPGSDSHLEGGLILRHAERRLVLLDQEGIAVDVRQADQVELIEPGSVLVFPFFRAVVRDIWASPIVPLRLGQSPLRPRGALGPRALFPLDRIPVGVVSRPNHVGLVPDSVTLPSMQGTCPPLTCQDRSSGGTGAARVNSPRLQIPSHSHQISRYQHIWDKGRAAGKPRVVFVDKEIRPAILRSVQPPSWRGTVNGDRCSFASVARSASSMSSYGRGGRGGPQYPSRPNFAPRRPPGGFAAGSFEGGQMRQNQQQQDLRRDFPEGNRDRVQEPPQDYQRDNYGARGG
jgi:hypothetical protein